MIPRSISQRFSSQDWANELSTQSKSEIEPVCLNKLMSEYAQLDEFFARRVATAKHFDEIPPMHRNDVADVRINADPEEVIFFETSGTSGEQIKVASTPTERMFRRVLNYRPFDFYDLPDEVRQMAMMEYITDAVQPVSFNTLSSRGRRYVRAQVSISASPKEQLDYLELFSPHILTGYPSAMVALAGRFGTKLRDLGIEVLSPAGEFLTNEWREALVECYGAKVYDRYGTTEAGALAWECPQCGMYHANVDEMVLEIECDHTLVTPYFLRCQPLLRYRFEDILAAGPNASCEVRLPSIQIREARRDDCLYDHEGNRVSSWAMCFEKFYKLKAFRVHQDETRAVLVYVDYKEPLTTRVINLLEDEVRFAVPGVPVRVVDGVHLAPRTRKFKRFTSEYCPLESKL